MLSLSVRLVAGQRVRLPSGLSPLVSLLVGHCVPLLVGHCVRLVSLLFPFVFLLVPLLVGHVSILSLSPVLFPFLGHCVRLVSLLFPFVSLLVSLLVDRCVRLVSLLFSFVSFLSPSCWSLCPPRPFCLPLSPVLSLFCFLLSPFLLLIVSALSPFYLPLSPVLSPFLLDTVSVLSPFCFLLSLFVGHCVRLVFLLSFTCASSPPLSLATLHICLPAALPCNPLHLSPSSGLRVACNPLHLSPCVYICLPALDCCVCLCLAILYICLPALAAVSASALQSFTFVSQRWAAVSASALQSLILHLSPSFGRRKLYLQSVPILKKHKLFGVYGGVIILYESAPEQKSFHYRNLLWGIYIDFHVYTRNNVRH